VAHKKKVIKCFVCGTEWTAGEDEAHSSTIKCPHCSINDFSGNFIIKEKEDKVESSRLFKPQWVQPTGETEGGKGTDGAVLEAETKAPTPSVKKEFKSTHGMYGGAASTQNAAAAFLESDSSDGTKSSGGSQVYGYIKESDKKTPKPATVAVITAVEKKNEPKSVSEELTSSCFIVTATYGTGSYDRISVFYRFRDEFLLKSIAGRLFTQAYYRISPYPANVIRRSKTLKAASRFFLDRLAPIIRRLL
jgi:DNA-directed RNA polymerase subunit RPC12/RpoP